MTEESKGQLRQPLSPKVLKFRESLSRLVLSGSKDTTWRLFDDKNLSAGDLVSFVIWETRESFAEARITATRETTFGKLTEEDWAGHEKYPTEAEMYATYSGYYGRSVTSESPVKILKFELR